MPQTKEPIDFIIYLILFGSSIFVNKYVLSVLNFTYPTIFQGWQTLVGGILLRVLLMRKCLSTGATDIDKAGFISLLPSFLFFSAGIVASSKALASLSIPIFLGLQNTLHATLYLLEIAPTFKGGAGRIALCACLVTISSAVAAVCFEINMNFSDSPYFWMLVYLACLAVQSLHSKIADARYNEVDRLYYSYIFSVIILCPASLYLEEAFEVLKFPNASRYDFYAGCVLSGILGLFLNISITKVKCHHYFSAVDSFARLITSCLSLVTFDDRNSIITKAFLFVNLLSAVFVPLPRPKEPTLEDEDRQTLISEEP